MKTYNIGDLVWVATFESREERVACPVCYGNKEVIVILGNGDQVVVVCDYCCKGFEGPQGYVKEYRYAPRTEQVKVTKCSVETTLEGIKTEYRFNNGRLYQEEDLFDTQEEAAQAAEIKAVELEQREMNKVKYKNEKSYSWNAGYHMRAATQARKDAEHHEQRAKLCKERSRTKE